MDIFFVIQCKKVDKMAVIAFLLVDKRVKNMVFPSNKVDTPPILQFHQAPCVLVKILERFQGFCALLTHFDTISTQKHKSVANCAIFTMYSCVQNRL